jgi:hypothetical protein
MMPIPAPGIGAALGPDWATHRAFAGSALMKIQTIEDFARPQDLAALRGVMSRLITRFPENGEILDLIKVEYPSARHREGRRRAYRDWRGVAAYARQGAARSSSENARCFGEGLIWFAGP